VDTYGRREGAVELLVLLSLSVLQSFKGLGILPMLLNTTEERFKLLSLLNQSTLGVLLDIL